MKARPPKRRVAAVDTYARDETTVPREAGMKRREPWPRPPPLPPKPPRLPPPPPPPSVVLTSGSPSATTELRRVPQTKSKSKWALVVVAVFAGVFWWRLEQSSVVPNALEKAPSVFAKRTPSATRSEPAPPSPPPPPTASSERDELAHAETSAAEALTEMTSPLLGTIRLAPGAMSIPALLAPATPIGSELALPGAPPLPHPPPIATTPSFGPVVITPAWHAPKTPRPSKPHAHLKPRAKAPPEPPPIPDAVNEKLDNALRQARRD